MKNKIFFIPLTQKLENKFIKLTEELPFAFPSFILKSKLIEKIDKFLCILNFITKIGVIFVEQIIPIKQFVQRMLVISLKTLKEKCKKRACPRLAYSRRHSASCNKILNKQQPILIKEI